MNTKVSKERQNADVVELADTEALKASDLNSREGSNPSICTKDP